MTVFLDPRIETRDGHHGWAIESVLRQVLGETYDRPASEWRQASERLSVGPGTLVAPPGGWVLRSIRDLDIDFDHTTIVGRGDSPAVLEVDGCPYGRITGTPIIKAERAANGGRLEVPRDGLLIHMDKGLQQTHFRFNGRIEGVWRECGYRGGHTDATFAQEDHYTSDEIRVHGNYDIHNDNLLSEADLCKYGVWAGNPAWSNNRRHYYGLVHVAWCETAFRNQRVYATVQRLIADGCRDYLMYGAGKVVVNGGEAEYCARFVNDIAWDGHDFPLVIRDAYIKLDLWRRGMGGIDPRFSDSAYGVWGTRGNCYLQNVTVSALPVERNAAGTLKHMDGGPPPKFWTTQPAANVFVEQGTSVHGYRRSEAFAFESQGSGTCRAEVGWKDTDPAGFVRRTMLDATNMRGS